MDIGWSKAYLNGVRSRWVMVDYYSRRIQNLEEQLVTFGGGGFGEKVQSSPRHDALEARVLKFIENEEKIILKFYDLLEDANAKQDEAMDRISLLKEGHRKDFLIEYYVNRLSIREIADQFEHADEDSTRKLQRLALEYFEEMAELYSWKK